MASVSTFATIWSSKSAHFSKAATVTLRALALITAASKSEAPVPRVLPQYCEWNRLFYLCRLTPLNCEGSPLAASAGMKLGRAVLT